MEAQNKASRTNQADQVPQNQGGVTSYLINTSKAVKGGKLKTKDFIRVQLLKFRRCSPVKYNQVCEQNVMIPCKTIAYRKFKAFETIENEQIHKIISDQRQQMSRDKKVRTKLFNNTKINTMFFDQSMNITHGSLAVRPKAATAHQSRPSVKRNHINYKTVSQGNNPASASKSKAEKEHAIFRSDNLGTKMNDYLNLYLYRQEDKDGKQEEQREQTEQSRVSQQKNVNFLNATVSVAKKKANHPFMRQMKKHCRGRGEEGFSYLLPHFKSEDMANHLSANISQRQWAAKIQNNTKLFNKNCTELTRKYNKLTLSQQSKKQKQSQTDRAFGRSRK